MSDYESAAEWHCFPESAPPNDVVQGWRALLDLPRAAQQNLWHVIEAALVDADNPDNRQLIENYAQRFEANAGNVVAAVRAADFLLRQAASIWVTLADFRADVERLSAGNPAGVELLCSRYDEVQSMLRNHMLEDALADQGNVLTGFDWRVDRLQKSSRGDLGDTPVVMMRLKYRNADEESALSLQLTGAAVETLAEFCGQFIVPASPSVDSDAEPPENSERPPV